MSLVSDSMLQDTVPQHVNQSPIENSKQSSPMDHQDGANAMVNESSLGLSAAHWSIPDALNFETLEEDIDSSIESIAHSPGPGKKQSTSVAAMDGEQADTPGKGPVRDGKVQVPGRDQTYEEIDSLPEESLDYGCVPKNRRERSPLPGSTEEDEFSQGKGNKPTLPQLAGALREDAHDPDYGPTDEQLLRAVRSILASVKDIVQPTPKQALLMLEKQFSCTLEDRKELIFREFTQTIRGSIGQGATGNSERSEPEVLESNGNLPVKTCSSPSSSGGEGQDKPQADPLASENSMGGNDSESSFSVSGPGVNAPGNASEDRFPFQESDGDRAASSSSSDGKTYARSAVDEVGRGSASSSESAADNSPDSGKRPSAEATASGSELGENSDLPDMPRPRASKTPARRALAKAKMKSAARGARVSKTRRTIRQSGTAASSASNSDSQLLDSDSDPGSTASSAKPRIKAKQQERNETGASPGDASGEENESAEAPRSAGLSMSAGSSSDLGESSSSLKHVRRGTQGKGKKKSAAKKRAAKRRSAGKAAVNDDGAGSTLLDSDEEAGCSKNERPSSVEKAVVQEELDDVNEEKLKERKRIAAERQRQLDALRVMNAAQLKEATRAQQGNLLAKIKERQARIHAEMAATATEELKMLRVEARRAAGMTDEAEEDEEEGGGTGLKPTDVDVEKDGDMDIEDMVAKEEAVAVAAAASVAVGQDHVDSTGEEVEEEEEDSGFAVKEEAAPNNAAVENSSRALGSKTIGGDRGDSNEEATSSSESDSDSELEILPADSTSALGALVKRFDDPSGGVKLVAGRPQQTQKMISRSGKEGSTAAAAQGTAARALAALPKGVRFSSPKMADSVRAANRRRLAASARAVANDRWAAQLGYQDGQEHIRDLKYMELKRRQQAHRERERKAEENEAMEARLREYAANADAEEEEFGADPSDGKAPISSVVTVPAQTDVASGSTLEDDAVGGIEPAPEDVSMDSIVASVRGEGDDVHKAAGLEDVIQGSNPFPGSEGGGSRDEVCEAKNGGTLLEGATESSRVAIQGIAPEGGVSENDESSQRSALSISGVPQDAPQAAEDTAGAAVSDQVEATPTGDVAGGATNPSSSDALATTILPAARPEIVRTYGRKKPSGQSLDQASKVSFKASEQTGGSDSTTERSSDKSFSLAGGEPVVSPESQALWEEEPGPEPPSRGATPESLGEDCSCSVSLNLFDERDEATQQSHSSSKGSASVAPSQDVGVDGDAAKHAVPSVILDQSTEIVVARALKEDGSGDDCQGGGRATTTSTSGSGVTTKANTATTSWKIKLAADGELVAAPTQPSLPFLFKAAAGASSCSPHRSKNIATVEPPRSTIGKDTTGIAAYFGVASNSSASAGTGAAPTQYDDSNLESEGVLGSTATAVEASLTSTGYNGDNATSYLNSDAAVLVGKTSNGAAKDESGEKGSMDAQHKNVAEKGEDNGNERERKGKGNDEEKSKEPKDRSAKFRAMLEAERETNRRVKKLRKTGMMDDEAEEEEEEEAVRGLGDFGFGVLAGGTGTSAMGNGGKKDDEEEEGIDEEIREEDLEGIVDTFSDDEGDKDAQEAFLKNEAAAGERQALKDMVRRVREGFGEERGGRGRGANARGNLRLDELTAADKSSRKEARRLGLLNSDEEWSDDEKDEGDGGEKDELDELDEVQLGELLAREQRARHMGLSQTAQDYLESSDSEADEEGKGEGSGDAAGGEAEDAERREEDRIQKLWVKKAKRRRVLAEVEQAGTGNNQSPSELLMQEDKDSQAILSLLHCTNSRLGMSGSVGRGVSVGGIDSADASANKVSGGGKRRARDQYTGELDAQEVENGFGMGMSSKPLKRTKSDGTKPKGVDPSEAEARMNRAFTMPQFVTSVAGYGSSTRAKQIQRKGSFLARSRSLHARSGSLAAGKTTVSASKFVFVSSASGADDDTCARTGFEDSASRESLSAGGGGRGSGAPSSELGANSDREKARVFSEIGVKGKEKRKIERAEGGPEMGRLWKGLCANGKPKSRR